ncbi:MAG TPA: hypothetical protein VFT13_07170 [Candidatus Krumholzibacteria bacterium]|nr:hypothetical protein [Candidatus Krumholzibacteria bacterium]
MNTRSLLLIGAAALLTLSCAKRTLVEVPPQVDLYPYNLIGVVQFTSESKGTLASFATQRFIEVLQEAQPGVRVLELGTADEIVRTLDRDDMNFQTVRAIGEHYGVGAVILGTLDVQDVKPRVDLQHMLTTAGVSADVTAALTTRLMETTHGATAWTRTTRATSTVAQVGMSGGVVRFDAKDPERVYGAMVDGLIADLSQDFRVTYVRK